MTNYEKIKSMSIEEMATAIYNGISSDPCDYCAFYAGNINGSCNAHYCNTMSNTEIIAKWLESEAEE